MDADHTTFRNDEQTQAYTTLLSDTLASPSAPPHALSLYLDAILSDSLAQIVARPCLTDYVAKIRELGEREVKKEVMGMSLQKMQNKITSFEEQVRLSSRVCAGSSGSCAGVDGLGGDVARGVRSAAGRRRGLFRSCQSPHWYSTRVWKPVRISSVLGSSTLPADHSL